VTIHDDYEVTYRSERLGCTQDELKALGPKAGSNAKERLRYSNCQLSTTVFL